MTVMRKLTLLLLCLALGIGVCDAKKKNRGVYFPVSYTHLTLPTKA